MKTIHTKRIICVLLSVLLILGACTFGAYAAGEPADTVDEHPALLAGDADRDGDVTIMDATKIQRTVAELEEMDDMSRQVAKNEFSADELTILDATNIQRWLAELHSAATTEVKRPAFIWKDGRYISIIEDYKNTFDPLLEKYDFYGVLYVTRNGRVLYSNAYSDDSFGFTIDTLFPIGSVSKQFCAAAIMLLHQQGKLSVDDTLEKYFPEYTEGKDITIRNLLNMRAGIIDYVNNAVPQSDYDVSENYTAEQNKQNIKEFIFSEELLDDPDFKFRYSNTNYFLLSLIVEQVSGESYNEFMQENFFTPLGMDSTGFYTDLVKDPRLAKMRVEFVPIESEVKGLTQGAGDIVSCAKDMDKWLTSFKTHAILTEESVKEISIRIDGYGFGFNVDKDGSLWHEGMISDYMSKDYTDPSINFNIFASTSVLDMGKSETAIKRLVSGAIFKLK